MRNIFYVHSIKNSNQPLIQYKIVSNKEAFNPQALADFQQKYKDKKINQLKNKIAKLEAA